MGLPARCMLSGDRSETRAVKVTWIHKVRLRVLAVLVGMGLAVLAVTSWTAIPALPVIGVAVAFAAAAVNKVSSRLNHPTCWSCGIDLAGTPVGAHGSICPDCGAVNELAPEEDRLA